MTIPPTPVDYALHQDGDIWVAVHVETGVASQGETPSVAVSMAQEASELAQQTHEVGDEQYQREMLVACGIDPAEVKEGIDHPTDTY